MELLDCPAYAQSLAAGFNPRFLRGKTIVITGAAGLLGSCLTDALLLWNRTQDNPCQIYAVGRDTARARARFPDSWTDPRFTFLSGDVAEPISGLPDQADYIVHAASNADPARMARFPVDTLTANVLGTLRLLDYGRTHGMARFLLVSSGEAYGQPDPARPAFTEDYCGPLDLSSPRACYPEGKRAAEVLCQSAIAQYGTDAVIVRPCHLFGPSQTLRDSRAASEFLRQAAAGEPIHLKSAGLFLRSHCYAPDAVRGIMTALERGETGGAYNIADRRYELTVGAFAERAASAGGVRITAAQPTASESAGYTTVPRSVLDPSRLEKLGWRPADRARDAIVESVEILRWRLEQGLQVSPTQTDSP